MNLMKTTLITLIIQMRMIPNKITHIALFSPCKAGALYNKKVKI